MKEISISAQNPPASLSWARTSDFLILTKPGITSLVLFTTFAGFYTAIDGAIPVWLLAHTLIGTALASGGAGAFNMYIERQLDVLMKRTALRPLAAGRLKPGPALIFALAISITGFVYLYILVNHLTSMLSAVIFAAYIFLYTPLKTRTWFSTFVGAVPGALPAVLGWAAANNELPLSAWGLFAIVFLWQMPHFYAIGWTHREDYVRAGFLLLPALDGDGKRICRQVLLFIVLLLAASSSPYFSDLAGAVYMAGAAIMGIIFLASGLYFARSRSRASAQILFAVSALYLPLLLILLVADKTA